MVDNATINVEGTKRGLDKLESVSGTENLRHSGILSNNLCDEVGDRSDNLKVIAEEVDSTHTSVVINKYYIVAMTPERGGMRGTPNIIV